MMEKHRINRIQQMALTLENIKNVLKQEFSKKKEKIYQTSYLETPLWSIKKWVNYLNKAPRIMNVWTKSSKTWKSSKLVLKLKKEWTKIYKVWNWKRKKKRRIKKKLPWKIKRPVGQSQRNNIKIDGLKKYEKETWG